MIATFIFVVFVELTFACLQVNTPTSTTTTTTTTTTTSSSLGSSCSFVYGIAQGFTTSSDMACVPLVAGSTSNCSIPDQSSFTIEQDACGTSPFIIDTAANPDAQETPTSVVTVTCSNGVLTTTASGFTDGAVTDVTGIQCAGKLLTLAGGGLRFGFPEGLVSVVVSINPLRNLLPQQFPKKRRSIEIGVIARPRKYV